MTGKEIADNLRNSKEKWTKGYLFKDADMFVGSELRKMGYCVLGLKCHEAGIPDELLKNETGFKWVKDTDLNVATLYHLNDASESKEALIATLEGPGFKDFNFDVEKFIERIRLSEGIRLSEQLKNA